MNKPDMPRVIDRQVHEHEVFLSFNSDSDAEWFHDWWAVEGWARFSAWAEGREADDAD
jgi:hypothetical protein